MTPFWRGETVAGVYTKILSNPVAARWTVRVPISVTLLAGVLAYISTDVSQTLRLLVNFLLPAENTMPLYSRAAAPCAVKR